MKKILSLAVALLLVGGVAFAADKGKKKKKCAKSKTECCKKAKSCSKKVEDVKA